MTVYHSSNGAQLVDLHGCFQRSLLKAGASVNLSILRRLLTPVQMVEVESPEGARAADQPPKQAMHAARPFWTQLPWDTSKLPSPQAANRKPRWH